MKKTLSLFVLVAFLTATAPQGAWADGIILLPKPGLMVNVSPSFTPAFLQGMTIDTQDPLKFDFIIQRGNTQLTPSQKQVEYNKLIKYFLAALAVPDEEQWVNLSPYEQNRIIPTVFGMTEMGRDLLAEDYLLKQMAASLLHPDHAAGKAFWSKVYAQAGDKQAPVPINTFNKVWIVPQKAVLYEKGNTVYVVESRLKVMLEEDYLAGKINSVERPTTMSASTKEVLRTTIIPVLEREVNEGKNFAPLRQMYSGMLLSAWYKEALKQTLLAKIYANQGKVRGVMNDPANNQRIYAQYVQAFKKGVFNLIKEDVDVYTQRIIPRKYFSGGMRGANKDDLRRVTTVTARQQSGLDAAMSTSDIARGRFDNADKAGTSDTSILKAASIGNLEERQPLMDQLKEIRAMANRGEMAEADSQIDRIAAFGIIEPRTIQQAKDYVGYVHAHKLPQLIQDENFIEINQLLLDGQVRLSEPAAAYQKGMVVQALKEMAAEQYPNDLKEQNRYYAKMLAGIKVDLRNLIDDQEAIKWAIKHLKELAYLEIDVRKYYQYIVEGKNSEAEALKPKLIDRINTISIFPGNVLTGYGLRDVILEYQEKVIAGTFTKNIKGMGLEKARNILKVALEADTQALQAAALAKMNGLIEPLINPKTNSPALTLYGLSLLWTNVIDVKDAWDILMEHAADADGAKHLTTGFSTHARTDGPLAVNGDSVLVDDRRGILLVADGIGEAYRANAASSKAKEIVDTLLTREKLAGLKSSADVVTLLTHVVAEVHTSLIAIASQRALESFGTSISLGVHWEDPSTHKIHFIAINKGNSRLYVRRAVQYAGSFVSVEKISKDDTQVQSLVDNNSITAEAAETHALRFKINDYLGVRDTEGLNLKPHQIINVELQKGDIVLGVSKGASLVLGQKRLDEIIVSSPAVPLTIAQNVTAEALRIVNANPADLKSDELMRNKGNGFNRDDMTVAGLGVDAAMKTDQRNRLVEKATDLGGIDFNAARLDIQIKRDANGMVLPLPQQNLDNIRINGLVPVILEIRPAAAVLSSP